MKLTSLPVLLLPLVCSLPSTAAAETARLVEDLTPGGSFLGSGAGRMVVLDDAGAGRQLVFYAADDGRHGNELWVTEVAAGGKTTSMVADLCPGSCSSDPTAFQVVGDRLFFLADEGVFGRALFTSRGSAATTTRIRELVDFDRAGLSRDESAVFGGQYFFANSAPTGACPALWASDGTRSGTRALESPCPRIGAIRHLTSTSLGVYFTVGDEEDVIQTYVGLHVAEADAQDADGFRVSRLAGCPLQCAIGRIEQLVELDGAVIFSTGGVLFRADAQSVQFLRSFGENRRVQGLQPYGADPAHPDRVIFQVIYTSFTPRPRYYETDGTVAGTVPSAFLGFADDEQVLERGAGDPVILVYSPLTHELSGATLGFHQMLLSGVQEQPVALRNTGAGGGSVFLSGGRLYHVDTTLQLRDFGAYADAAPWAATLPGAAGDTFYRLDDTRGLEPFFAERGYLAPTQVADIAVDGIRSSEPRPTPTADGYVALLGDGSLATVAADGASASVDDAGPYHWLAATGGKLFLATHDLELRLAVSTGGPAVFPGPDRVSEPWLNSPGAFGGKLYFTTNRSGQQVWVSDGTQGGSGLLYDRYPGWYYFGCQPVCPPTMTFPEYPLTIVADGERIFWDGFSPAWEEGEITFARLDETDADVLQTRLDGASARFLWQGRAYYTAGYNTPTLWASDGTEAGTRQLASLDPGVPLPTLFAGTGTSVYFVVHRHGGQQLWRTDGTPGGTGLHFDFGAGAAFGKMTADGSRVFVPVATPALGGELWVIENGGLPRLVRDLFPGPRSSDPSELHLLADGRLVFAADDGVHGAEAWITDGTADGTRLLADIAPDGAGGPRYFAERQGRLVFAADDGESGRELWTLVPGTPLPACPPDRLCLHEDRFEVTVDYNSLSSGQTSTAASGQTSSAGFGLKSSPSGAAGAGQRVLASSESGVFSFFDAANWELQVKVLNGCDLNDRYWVFAAATTDVEYTLRVLDRATGQTRSYHNPPGTLSAAITDTAAFATCGAAAPEPRFSPAEDGVGPAALCPGQPDAFCFGEWRVSVTWQRPDGQQGQAHPVASGSAESGLLTFFSADNWEMMVKLLDGCALNQHRWLFAAGSTDVGWTLTLEHRANPAIPPKVYRNLPGEVSPAIADVAAAACQP